jgi:serine phosphatase RsbU (regulator of sigma subunit)
MAEHSGGLQTGATDGITHAADAAGNMLGRDGLLAIARNLQVESPVLVADRLLMAVQNFRGNALPG